MQNLHSAVYKISHVSLFFVEGEGAKKFSRNIAERFAKILAKFHELKILTKPQHYVPWQQTTGAMRKQCEN